MQSVAMASFASCETKIEDAGQIFGWNSHTVVRDRDLDSSVSVMYAHGHQFIGTVGLVAGILCIAHQVDQNLEDFVLFDSDRGQLRIILTNELYVVPRQCAGVHPQGVLH